MSTMKRAYEVHNCAGMTDKTTEGLMRLHDPSRGGPLDVWELIALFQSPVMREWLGDEYAVPTGVYALEQHANGKPLEWGPKTLAAWLGTIRPAIRQKLEEVAS